MPDVPDYAAGVQRKRNVYQANGIPILFIYPQDLTGPNWPEKLYHRIEEAGQRALQRYPADLGVQVGQPYK